MKILIKNSYFEHQLTLIRYYFNNIFIKIFDGIRAGRVCTMTAYHS